MEPGVLERHGAEPEVVYEDGDIVVVNKPAGWQVHPARVSQKKKSATPEPLEAPATAGARTEEKILTEWLLKRYPEIKSVGDDPEMRPGIVHRLDKVTSGILVVARTQKAFEYLKTLFQKHEIEKKYLAVVLGVPKKREDTIDAPIGMKSGTLARSVRAVRLVKSAITRYRVSKIFIDASGREASLLEVTPKTGRTHQIRVHLASIGHPIVGDALYGGRRAEGGRLMLHALSLEFTAPDGKRVQLEAEPPPDFQAVIHS